MKVSRYHSFLRVSLLVTAFVLVFVSGFASPVTRDLSNNAISYLASVGSTMFASVPPNEINTLTAQLTEQQRALDAREAELREREITARAYNTGSETDYSTYILSVILFIIMVLLMLNYAMDWARARSLTHKGSMN